MTDINIPRGGNFSATWYVSGTDLTGDYARMLGYTSPSMGSPYLFDWNTSGGALVITGSTVSGGRIDAWIRPSGTSGLNFTIAQWELRVDQADGASTGSQTKFYDAGRADLIYYGG